MHRRSIVALLVILLTWGCRASLKDTAEPTPRSYPDTWWTCQELADAYLPLDTVGRAEFAEAHEEDGLIWEGNYAEGNGGYYYGIHCTYVPGCFGLDSSLQYQGEMMLCGIPSWESMYLDLGDEVSGRGRVRAFEDNVLMVDFMSFSDDTRRTIPPSPQGY